MDFAEGSTAPENQTKPYFAADDQIQERTIFAILTLRCKLFSLTSLKWLSDHKRSLACNFSLVCNFYHVAEFSYSHHSLTHSETH